MKTFRTTTLSGLGCLAMVMVLAGCRSETAGAPPVTKLISTEPALTSAPVPLGAPPAPAVAAPAVPPASVSSPGGTNAIPAGEVPVSAIAPQRPPLPSVVDDVVDMAQSSVGDAVLLEYVQGATNSYELTSDQIVYLKDVGLSEQVLTTLVRRGGELRAQGAPPAPIVNATTHAATPAAAPAQPAPAAPTATATAPAYVAAPPAPSAAPVQTLSAPLEPATVTQPVGSAYDYWYSTLSPYGSWVYLPAYGWCWQPTVATTVADWRPYSYGGHWVWSDAGWYWMSDYSWGWGPFHYGRWHLSPSCGWVWAPDTVWGPAWVTWRSCDDYWGWAPLPPGAVWTTGIGLTWYGSSVSFGFGFNLGWECYSFVPPHQFCHPEPWHYGPPHHEMAAVYRRTEVINNISVNNHHAIVNNGLPPSRYTQLTRQEVPKVTLQDVNPGRSIPTKPERLSSDGKRLAVYRPTIPNGSGATHLTPVSAPPSRRSQETFLPGSAYQAPVAGSRPGRALTGMGSPLKSGTTATVPQRNEAPRYFNAPAPVRSGTYSGPSRGTASSPQPAAGANRVPAAANTAPASGSRGELRKIEVPRGVNAAPPKYASPYDRGTVTVPRGSPGVAYSPSYVPARPGSATPGPSYSPPPRPSGPAPSIGAAPSAPSRPSYSAPPAAAPRSSPAPAPGGKPTN